MKAVAHHTDERWVLLYIERWLKAPMLMPDGTLVAREKGTPQGSPISPLLANLFMHYGFDRWMDREHPGCPFERYADDVVVHCDTEEQARRLQDALAARLGSLGLPGRYAALARSSWVYSSAVNGSAANTTRACGGGNTGLGPGQVLSGAGRRVASTPRSSRAGRPGAGWEVTVAAGAGTLNCSDAFSQEEIVIAT